MLVKQLRLFSRFIKEQRSLGSETKQSPIREKIIDEMALNNMSTEDRDKLYELFADRMLARFKRSRKPLVPKGTYSMLSDMLFLILRKRWMGVTMEFEIRTAIAIDPDLSAAFHKISSDVSKPFNGHSSTMELEERCLKYWNESNGNLQYLYKEERNLKGWKESEFDPDRNVERFVKPLLVHELRSIFEYK